MKTIRPFGKVLFVFFVVVMLYCIALPFSAIGVEKLVVKDSGGNTKFVVMDDGKVGVGTASPLSSFEINGNGTGPSQIYSVNTATGSNIGGGGMVLFSDDGVARLNGDRLGYQLFGGSRAAGQLRANAAGIAAYAAEPWVDGSAYGARFQFETVSLGATARTSKFKINANGDIVIDGLALPTTVGLTVKGAVSHTADLFQVKRSDDTVALSVSAGGGLRLNNTTARPTCDANSRGTFWVEQGATNDIVQVCAMTGGSLVWTTLQRL